jgi:hypothetical protein
MSRFHPLRSLIAQDPQFPLAPLWLTLMMNRVKWPPDVDWCRFLDPAIPEERVIGNGTHGALEILPESSSRLCTLRRVATAAVDFSHLACDPRHQFGRCIASHIAIASASTFWRRQCWAPKQPSTPTKDGGLTQLARAPWHE